MERGLEAIRPVGLQAAGDAFAGVGALFSAITGLLQRIANMVARAVQRLKVKSILDRAKQEWLIRDSDSGLVAMRVVSSRSESSIWRNAT